MTIQILSEIELSLVSGGIDDGQQGQGGEQGQSGGLGQQGQGGEQGQSGEAGAAGQAGDQGTAGDVGNGGVAAPPTLSVLSTASAAGRGRRRR